ncbi:hypothetical protein [Dyadobacter fermentans]|nr:hypothetical protein [Dyadobacter fermentans]
MDQHIENAIDFSQDQQPDLKALPGKPYPLGASWDGEGVNFALFTENAQA